jgi:hypothetical protein
MDNKMNLMTPSESNKVSKACKACANYGFGCQRPLTNGELYEEVQFYVDGSNRPDCWERE